MRTSEERARLIHRRTAEIKQEHRKKKQQGLYAVCMAACLFLVIGIGAMMPGLMKGAADGSIVHSSGTASLIGSHAAGRKYALFYHNPLTFRPDQAIRRILLELFPVPPRASRTV